jgi:hypothetical protein
MFMAKISVRERGASLFKKKNHRTQERKDNEGGREAFPFAVAQISIGLRLFTSLKCDGFRFAFPVTHLNHQHFLLIFPNVFLS